MSISWITCCHAPASVMDSGLTQVSATGGPMGEIFFVDHHYPIATLEAAQATRWWANLWGAHLLRPPKNLGGHGGVNYALRMIQPKDDDLVFLVDPDSYPLTPLWPQAMVDVLTADPTLAHVSLMIDGSPRNESVLGKHEWEIETIAGHRVGFLHQAEMWNVTLFRGKILQQGMPGTKDFWGGCEAMLYPRMRDLGLRSGYMYDFRETRNPVDHDPVYTEWKAKHTAGQFDQNFDEYLKHIGYHSRNEAPGETL